MPSSDQQVGARPRGNPERVNAYVSAGIIYPGDFVMQEAAGRVVVAAAASPLCGVAASYASAAGQEVLVYDDPAQRFIVQASAGEIDAQTDIGLNYDIVANAGSATYQHSRHEIDSATGAATATLPLKLLGIELRPDNTLGANVDCVVQINNHQFGSHTGTAGV